MKPRKTKPRRNLSHLSDVPKILLVIVKSVRVLAKFRAKACALLGGQNCDEGSDVQKIHKAVFVAVCFYLISAAE